MTRIAFTACSQFQRDAAQPVWDEIETHRPDHLMLLGDQIYMDYGGDHALDAERHGLPAGFVGYGNGEPAKLDLSTFEFQMRLRYRRQFEVRSFRALVHAVGRRHGTVGMVWDDHDFGFNNALGACGGPLDADEEYRDKLMCQNMKAVSRRLFEEFRRNVQALRGDAAAPYQTLPSDWQPARGKETVHAHHRLGPVEIFMLDTRSCRQSPARCCDARDSSILGPEQWAWLRDGLLADGPRLAVVASGSPFSSPGLWANQSWKQGGRGDLRPYREYHQLLALAARLHPRKRLLFVGGDRHDIEVIEDHPVLPELVCAGAAAPKPVGVGRHFCLLDLDAQARGGARLFTRGEEKLGWSTAPGRPEPRPPAPLSSLFLITNRAFVDGEPTCEPTCNLRYFRFEGGVLREPAARLKHWCEIADANDFWDQVQTYCTELRLRNPLNQNQLCFFVPGNRETSESAIAEYRGMTAIAFDAQGDACLGASIAFDWASEFVLFPSRDNYAHNVERAEKGVAPQLFHGVLQRARRVSTEASVLLSVCAQSLGNRLALTTLACMPELSVDRWFANAADLSRTVFCTAPGKAALRACRAVLVPYTRWDQALTLLECHAKDKSPRLGRWGPPDSPRPPERVHVCDVSALVWRENPHGGLWQFPWAFGQSAGPLQSLFANGLALGCWI